MFTEHSGSHNYKVHIRYPKFQWEPQNVVVPTSDGDKRSSEPAIFDITYHLTRQKHCLCVAEFQEDNNKQVEIA